MAGKCCRDLTVSLPGLCVLQAGRWDHKLWSVRSLLVLAVNAIPSLDILAMVRSSSTQWLRLALGSDRASKQLSQHAKLPAVLSSYQSMHGTISHEFIDSLAIMQVFMTLLAPGLMLSTHPPVVLLCCLNSI